ncbi:MAG: DUF6304 family protein [Oscillospiraceae bacterium]|nr:DUF6304 family protein [Oscillospiraceae bacterium]
MQVWKAHYKDPVHDAQIDIINTEKEYAADPLSFTLDGITFRGTSLGDFLPAVGSDLEEVCRKFHILKAGGFEIGGNEVSFWYTLQRYAMATEIPVRVVRKCDGCELQGMIHIAFAFQEHDPEQVQARWYCGEERVYHDDVHVHDVSLQIDGTVYSSAKKTLCFEDALLDICRQMAQDYALKCCLTCQYADYSPFGNDDFGTMQCFRHQKEAYLKVNSKADYFKYLNDDCEYRQEKDFAAKGIAAIFMESRSLATAMARTPIFPLR